MSVCCVFKMLSKQNLLCQPPELLQLMAFVVPGFKMMVALRLLTLFYKQDVARTYAFRRVVEMFP